MDALDVSRWQFGITTVYHFIFVPLTIGLAPLIVKEVFHIISALRGTGVATLLIEQNARAALQISDYGYVLETGEFALEGPAAELAQNPRVIETYLGLAKKTA